MARLTLVFLSIFLLAIVGIAVEAQADRDSPGWIKAKKEKAESKAEKAKGEAMGKGEEASAEAHTHRLEALERQKEKMAEIHEKRLAKLQWIKDLAEKKGNDKLAEKVDQLVERENVRYSRVLDRLARRGEKFDD